MTAEMANPVTIFHGEHYLRHNQRRQEHLASLRLDLAKRSVLEVGAGIGDHTSFFLDRGCDVVVTEPREENLLLIRQRFPQLDAFSLDLNETNLELRTSYEIVYCYGTLYHLERPAFALELLSKHCTELLLLETCVSYHDNEQINLCHESAEDPSQARTGTACRPARSWIFNKLKSLFQFVYMPITQPWHEEFPTDWTWDVPPPNANSLWRSVFIASRHRIVNELLVESIPLKQMRL